MENYAKLCQTEFWMNVFERELEYLLKELKGCKTVLSVGCGPAIIERGLQEHEFEVTGLDISRDALDRAPDDIRTLISSAEDMYVSNSSFDAVIYIASLQFINNYKKAIQETRRVLKPRGKFLAMLLNPESEFYEGRQIDSYMNKIKHPYLDPIKEEVRKHFETAGEYFLGIQDEDIFLSNDSKLAALYVIKGIKK